MCVPAWSVSFQGAAHVRCLPHQISAIHDPRGQALIFAVATLAPFPKGETLRRSLSPPPYSSRQPNELRGGVLLRKEHHHGAREHRFDHQSGHRGAGV